MNLCTSLFVYIGSIGLYKRIVNADTKSITLAGFLFLFVIDYIALTDYAVEYHPCRVSFCL